MNNKISSVQVTNYMRVKRATLTLDGNTFVISGQNEAGKSSFVQAIEDAFGGSKFAPTMPIRRGATQAVTTINLSDAQGRPLVAEITHSKTGRRLVVKDADGKTQSSPQSIMDAFWAETSFDPSIFLISKADKQVEMLKKMGGLDFTALDKEKTEKYTLRSACNADASRLATIASSKASYPDAPKELVVIADKVAEREKADAHNRTSAPLTAKVTEAASVLARNKAAVAALEASANEIELEIKRLTGKLAEKAGFIHSGREAIDSDVATLDAAEQLLAAFKPIDVAPLNLAIQTAEETNNKVRANAEKAKATEVARAKQKESDALTARLDEIDEAKQEMLRGAKFPIPGMSLDGDDVTIDGLPLAQQSDMRRLAIGVEMATVMNPGKPLMLVRHGNLFTPENFHILEEIATRKNLTCIVEIAGTNVAGSKLVFEDGVGVEPEAHEAKQTEILPT